MALAVSGQDAVAADAVAGAAADEAGDALGDYDELDKGKNKNKHHHHHYDGGHDHYGEKFMSGRYQD